MGRRDEKLPDAVRKLQVRKGRVVMSGEEPDAVQYRVNGWGANHLEFPLDQEPIVRAVQLQRLAELEEFTVHVFIAGKYEGERDVRQAFRKLMGVAPSGVGS